MKNDQLDVNKMLKQIRSKKLRNHLAWIEPERLRLTKAVIAAGFPAGQFNQSVNPVLHYVSSVLALGALASRQRGAILRDRAARGSDGEWGRPDLRDVALRRLTGAALLELSIALKLGVCNIGKLPNIDDLILIFTKVCKIHPATFLAAIASAVHVFDAISECGDKIDAGQPGPWPSNAFFASLDGLERKAEEACADPWPADAAREAVALAIVRFGALAQSEQEFPAATVWSQHQSRGFEALRAFLSNARIKSCALIDWRPVYMEPTDFAEKFFSGALAQDALPFDVIVGDPLNGGEALVPVYVPRNEPFIYPAFLGALTRASETEIRGIAKLAVAPVSYLD